MRTFLPVKTACALVNQIYNVDALLGRQYNILSAKKGGSFYIRSYYMRDDAARGKVQGTLPVRCYVSKAGKAVHFN